MTHFAYIGLGSNLDDPNAQLRTALASLAETPGVRLIAQSSFYRSQPLGFTDQADFVNAVAKVETDLTPTVLMVELLAIEVRQGRIRAMKNGPRTLDLDLLLYDQLVLNTPGLELPHPRLAERAFVLAPLLELDPHLTIPTHGPVQALLARLGGQVVVKLAA